MRKFLLLVLMVPFLSTCGVGAVAVVSGGVLYGFVIDGLTGQRLDFFDADGKLKNVTDNDAAKTQIYVVVNGVFIRAQPCDPNDASEDNEIDTSGCFRFEGLPYETTIALFVQRPTYRPFEGTTFFNDPYRTPAVFAPSADGPDLIDPPESITQYANIRLFPVGFSIDYRIFVHLNGTAVPGATVNCAWQTTANSLGVGGTFLAPDLTTTGKVAAATTDADGVALISGGALVPGATYHCEVFRTERFDGSVLAGEVNFIAGVDEDNQSVGLTSNVTARDLYALSSNADDALDLLGLGAALVIKMNRPVEAVPGLADCWTAFLNEPDVDGDANVGVMPNEAPNTNSVSETADVQVSADGLTVTVSYKQPTVNIDSDDRGTTMAFDGIYLRPRGTDDAGQVVRIGGNTACNADNAAPFNGAPALFNVKTGATQRDTISLF